MLDNTHEVASTIAGLDIWNNWSATDRGGDTGIGKLYEDLLGITENNLQDADLNGVEIKAGRAGSSALTTLFTRNPCTPTRALHAIVPRYGYETVVDTASGRVAVPTFNTNFAVGRVTRFGEARLTLLQNRADLDLVLVDVTAGTHEIARWHAGTIEGILARKLPALCVLDSESRFTASGEEFRLAAARSHRGLVGGAFHRLIGEGVVSLHCRVKGRPSGRGLRNRGCAFRIDRQHIHQLYEDTAVIDGRVH